MVTESKQLGLPLPICFHNAFMEHHVDGTHKINVRTIDDGDSPYALLITDDVLICDTSVAPITVNLFPVANNNGKIRRIKNIGANNVTVDGNGGETIDDELTQIIGQYECMVITDDATEWWVV